MAGFIRYSKFCIDILPLAHGHFVEEDSEGQSELLRITAGVSHGIQIRPPILTPEYFPLTGFFFFFFFPVDRGADICFSSHM